MDVTLPIQLPAVISKGIYLETLLQIVVATGADDLLLTSDAFAFLKLDKKMVRLTNRKCNTNEVELFSAFLNENVSVAGITGQGNAVDTVYSLPLNDDLCLMSTEGRQRLLSPKNMYRFRVNISRCEGLRKTGLTLTLRRISAEPLPLSAIGMSDAFADDFLRRKIGLTLIAGATGQGKSTTLSSIISYLAQQPNAHENIVTAESPIEYVYFAVNKPTTDIKQLQVGRDVPSFSEAVRRMLRMALTTGLIGEMRDEDTIRRANLLAQTGHRVFSTVHANNVAQIIPRCIASVAQSSANQVRADLIANINSLMAQQLILGRDGKKVAVREILHFNEGIRKTLSTCSLTALDVETQSLIHDQGISFSTDAHRLLSEGVIDEKAYEVFIGSRA